MEEKISVIIPTIEEESLFAVIEHLRKLLGKDIEIVVVDKSSDEYFDRIKKAGVVAIRQKDSGVENAIMLGLRSAKGSILASIDADGTHEVAGIKKALEIIEAGKADLVLGNRLNGLEKGSMSFYLKFGNSVLSWIFSRVYKTKIHDVLTGLFVMRRSSFDSIKETEPYRAGIAFFAVELARRGYRIGEVDIKYYKRKYGPSKLANSKFAYGLGVAAHLIRRIRDYSPLLIFGGLGVVFILFGGILGVFVLISFIRSGLLTEIGRALIAFMLVVLGFLMIATGFILDLLLEIEKIVSRK